MRKVKITIRNFAFLGMLSLASAEGDWCPHDKVVVENPSVKIKIEGIIDYEDLNYCEIKIKQKEFTSRIFYTEDGSATSGSSMKTEERELNSI